VYVSDILQNCLSEIISCLVISLVHIFFSIWPLLDMPRKLTKGVKEKRKKKANRKIEEVKDLPDSMKCSMIEGLY